MQRCKVTFSQARKRREQRIALVKHMLALIVWGLLFTTCIGWLLHIEQEEIAVQKRLDADYCAKPGHSETYCYNRKD